MLPIFDPKKAVGTIIERRGKRPFEAAPEVMAPEAEELDPALKDAASDILAAIQAKSVTQLYHALIAAHEACDGYEHKEGPHTNDESFDDEGEV